MSRRIAVIDDDGVFLAMLHDLLREEGYESHVFPAEMATYARVRACTPHAIVVDIPSLNYSRRTNETARRSQRG